MQFCLYCYDLASQCTSVTTASGTINYPFDERNRLDLVLQGIDVLADYDYDAVNNRIRTRLGNGTEEQREYDLLNRLKSLENRKLTATGAVESVISRFDYALDKVGNRTKVTELSGRSMTYTYDDLYRLTKEVIDETGTIDDRTIEYYYDKVGNRLRKKEALNGTTTQTDYQYDKNDRLLWEKQNGLETARYTYDNNGSTLSKVENGVTTTYTWNNDKRLVGATIQEGTGAPKQLQYRYNDDGIRVSSTVDGVETRYLLDELQAYPQVLEEYTTNGAVQVSYVYGHDLIHQTQGEQTTYYHVDGLGSTTELTNTTGNVVSRSRYDAFGEKVKSEGAISNKYLFAGEQFDSNLEDYYLRDRYYDVSTGRFTRRDSYHGSVSDPITLQKYIYADANPVTGIDPTGFVTTLAEANVVMQEQAGLAAIASPSVPFAIQAARITVGFVALLASVTAAAFILETVINKKKETEFKLYPDEPEKRKKIDNDTQKANQMRVQLQYGTTFTHAIGLLNTPETGVTKFQVRTGLVELWNTSKTHATWFPFDDFKSAFAQAIVLTSEWLNTTRSVSGGGTVHSEQWDLKGKKVTKGAYRLDTENLRGKNLIM